MQTSITIGRTAEVWLGPGNYRVRAITWIVTTNDGEQFELTRKRQAERLQILLESSNA